MAECEPWIWMVLMVPMEPIKVGTNGRRCTI
jgi:hypothetical protein